MSYSFSAKGATKTDAILAAEARFDKVCQDMPVHEKDKDAVLSHMRNMVNLLVEPSADEEVLISMNGWMSCAVICGEAPRVGTVSAGCSASIARSQP